MIDEPCIKKGKTRYKKKIDSVQFQRDRDLQGENYKAKPEDS